MPHCVARVRGFTLIEMITVVAIIGIIATISWSYYNREMLSNRRRDAVMGLISISQVLQRCKTDVGDFSQCTVSQVAPNAANTAGFKCGMYTYNTNANVVGASYTILSPDCTYNVTIDISAADRYTLTAQNVAVADNECLTLTLDNLGRKGYTGAAPDYHRCWGN